MKQKTLYVDMDGVLVDFQSGIDRLTDEERAEFAGNEDDCPRIFELMEPMPGAIEGFTELAKHFDTYILSTSPWKNPNAPAHKLAWVKKHFGDGPESPAYKRLILSHHKGLHKGEFIIDDRDKHGVLEFGDGHLHFRTDSRFLDWKSVVDHLIPLA